MTDFPEMTPAQSIQFMLTLPWTMGDVSDAGATYDEREVETVLDYVRQIETRAEAAIAERDALHTQIAHLVKWRDEIIVERDALREQIAKLRELVEQHAKEQHMGSVWLEAQVKAICK